MDFTPSFSKGTYTVTRKYRDWPETVTIGDQDYYRTGKGLAAA